MARSKVYEETTETSDDAAAQSSNGASGWEDAAAPAEPIGGYAKHKGRHVDDGSGVCKKCGKTIGEAPTPPGKQGRPKTSNSLTIEMVASMAWLGVGMGLEKLPAQTPGIGVIAQPVEREDGSYGAAPSVAAGRVMQLEASIAGKRIDKAIKGTVVAKFINGLLNASGPWAELLPLLLPPLLVGGAAAFPTLLKRYPVLQGMMIATMLPVLTEAAKLAEQQQELVGNLQAVSQENIAQTASVIQDILSNKDGN